MNILQRLENENVVEISLTDDKKSVQFVEKCDSWFGERLNKKDFGLFIDELKEIYNQMIEN